MLLVRHLFLSGTGESKHKSGCQSLGTTVYIVSQTPCLLESSKNSVVLLTGEPFSYSLDYHPDRVRRAAAG